MKQIWLLVSVLLIAVAALVANAIVLSVQDRIRDHAVLQTLGFSGGLIGRLIVAEGLLLSLVGGAVGAGGAWAIAWWGQFAISSEGQAISLQMGWQVVVVGLAASSSIGVLAGLVPAWQASRREIAGCFRAV